MFVARDPGRVAAACRDHPGAAVLDHADALWARAEDVDLVVVATPHRAHIPLARAARESGLPVVVDKPLAPEVGCGFPALEIGVLADDYIQTMRHRRMRRFNKGNQRT